MTAIHGKLITPSATSIANIRPDGLLCQHSLEPQPGVFVPAEVPAKCCLTHFAPTGDHHHAGQRPVRLVKCACHDARYAQTARYDELQGADAAVAQLLARARRPPGPRPASSPPSSSPRPRRRTRTRRARRSPCPRASARPRSPSRPPAQASPSAQPSALNWRRPARLDAVRHRFSLADLRGCWSRFLSAPGGPSRRRGERGQVRCATCIGAERSRYRTMAFRFRQHQLGLWSARCGACRHRVDVGDRWCHCI